MFKSRDCILNSDIISLLFSVSSAKTVLINLHRKCLWKRFISRFICKIIKSLPANDSGMTDDGDIARSSNASACRHRGCRYSYTVIVFLLFWDQPRRQSRLNEVVWDFCPLSPGATRFGRSALSGWGIPHCFQCSDVEAACQKQHGISED